MSKPAYVVIETDLSPTREQPVRYPVVETHGVWLSKRPALDEAERVAYEIAESINDGLSDREHKRLAKADQLAKVVALASEDEYQVWYKGKLDAVIQVRASVVY